MFGLNYFSKKREAKIIQKKKEEANISGIYIERPPEIDRNNKLYFVLGNALLNFLATVGCYGSFKSAFNIPCNMALIILCALIFSVLFAFIYYNTFSRVSIYICSFILFLFIVMNYGFLVRGGFAHILNRIMEFLQVELDLPIERSYDVYGYSGYFSITFSVIFILFCAMLMFNMAISESKGFVVVFLFTFPIIQLGLYFDRNINMFYFGFYMIGIIALAMLRNSYHYKMEYKKRKGYREFKRKNEITYNYTNDGKHLLNFVIMFALVVLLSYQLVNAGTNIANYKVKAKDSMWKESTYDFARRFAIVGFWGMVNPDGRSAGGVGRSRLGNSKYVSLDYSTDLIVKMPITEEDTDLYLKSFYGSYYKDNYWYTQDEVDNSPKMEDYNINSEEAYKIPVQILKNYEEIISNYHKKVEIVNVAANTAYYYIPYNILRLYEESDYTEFDDETNSGLDRNWSTTNYPITANKVENIDEFKEQISQAGDDVDSDYFSYLEKNYSEYVKAAYMDVPKENVESIKNFCDKYGLTKDSENIVEKVKQVFLEDFEYTLIPGKTPKNKDFVNYFLDKQKKGYCSYFASASTLIFRYLGIPARYTGGYVLFTDDYVDGVKQTDNLSDWIYENDFYSLNDYSGVYEFELSDANAHAWVEIYIDGYGWMPVDTTPPTDEDNYEEEKQQNAGMMQYLTENVFTKENFDRAKKTTKNLVVLMIAGGIGTIIGFVIVGMFVRRKRRYAASAEKVYINLCRVGKLIRLERAMEETYESYGQRLVENGHIEEEVILKINAIVEKEKYSLNTINESELKYVQKNVEKYIENIYANSSFYKVFVYKFIRWI